MYIGTTPSPPPAAETPLQEESPLVRAKRKVREQTK